MNSFGTISPKTILTLLDRRKHMYENIHVCKLHRVAICLKIGHHGGSSCEIASFFDDIAAMK